MNNLLLSQATIPLTALDDVGRLPGVARTVPIETIGGVVGTGRTKLPAFVIGHPIGRGGPWHLHSGRDAAASDEVVIDGRLQS